MNRRIYILAALCGLFAGSPAAAAIGCAQLSGSGIVRIDNYDPLGSDVLRENFQLQFTQPAGGPGGFFYIQFVNGGGAGGASRGALSARGPYEILPVNRTDNLVAGNAFVPPMTMADGDGWMRVSFDSNGHSPAIANLRLNVREGMLPVGVHREQLDIRVACPNGSSFDYDTLASAVEVQIGVDNTLRVDAGSGLTISLNQLSPDGPAATAGVDIPLEAAGPFNISFASENHGASQAGTQVGMLLRDGAGPLEANSQIPYTVRVDQQDVSQPGQQVRCAGRTGPLRIEVVTLPAPAAGRRAGDYRDMLEVTLTPNLDGPPATAGCSLLQ